jgi:RNA polymerase sigma-70 factor (ECF subfamily)
MQKGIYSWESSPGMSTLSNSYEQQLLEKIKNNDKSSFAIIFTCYYKDLVTFSYGFVRNLNTAEEIVQDVFILLWESRSSLAIEKSLKSYLLKSVQNRSLNWLNHLKVQSQYALYTREHQFLSENDTENYILHSELEQSLNQALGRIPVEYAEPFRLNRFNNLSYPDIAQKLGVSVRTIEVRISKALQLLRKELKEFLMLITILMYFN